MTRDINRGLTLESYGDRVGIRAYDFATDELLREVTIANPLVPFDAVSPNAPGAGGNTTPGTGTINDAGSVSDPSGSLPATGTSLRPFLLALAILLLLTGSAVLATRSRRA